MWEFRWFLCDTRVFVGGGGGGGGGSFLVVSVRFWGCFSFWVGGV
jgi:hypothetical protein